MEIWKPGSFTKNFSWGRTSGLLELYQVIRLGFDGEVRDVSRDEFRERVRHTGRPDFIPINFFLFNKIKNGDSYLCADELVFQAINYDHSPAFDKLALFAFNLSLAGKWAGARKEQRRPALWANAYIRERLARELDWNVGAVSADDIESFIRGDQRYRAETSRKVATNLNHLFVIGRLREFSVRRIERWWVDCLFLALDRIIEDRALDDQGTMYDQYSDFLLKYGFLELTGGRTLEKDLALKHLVRLYGACGGRMRFSDEAVKERSKILMPDLPFSTANDPRPRGAVHNTNPRILKSIPPFCAMLAKYAGFEEISPDELESFDLEEFIRTRAQAALSYLKDAGIRPNMTAEELLKLTRDQ